MVEFVGRPPRPIWQEAPLTFRMKVAESLDRLSQNQFRLVSKSDKEIVDKCEKFFAKVKIRGGDKWGMPDSACIGISFKHRTDKPLNFYNNWTHVADRFLLLSGNPVHTIGVLFINLIDIPQLMNALQGRLVTQIKVEHLQLKRDRGEQVDLNESFFEFMKMIRPGATFKFICESIPFEQLNRFSEMEQWKWSKGLDLLADHNIPSLDGYYHFNSLRLNIHKMSVKDAKKLIEAFIHKPAGTYKHNTTFFRIFTKEYNYPAAILISSDAELKAKVTNKVENYRDQIRVQVFPMANSDMMLLVKAAGKFFSGTVCRRDKLMQDYHFLPEL